MPVLKDQFCIFAEKEIGLSPPKRWYDIYEEIDRAYKRAIKECGYEDPQIDGIQGNFYDCFQRRLRTKDECGETSLLNTEGNSKCKWNLTFATSLIIN